MLIEVTPQKYNLVLDLKYATLQNFVKEKLYNKAICYLHNEAAEKLKIACKLSNNLGYQLKIFDGYRPITVQQYIWDKFEDERFLSNPATGSTPHCRGVAIDLTLLDKDKNELDMGTEFDHFSSKAFHGSTEISVEAQKNRLLLLGIMTQAGWDFYSNEWWHYQLHNARNYEIIKDFPI